MGKLLKQKKEANVYAFISRFIKKIELVNHTFDTKLPLIFKLLLHLTPAVSGSIFDWKYWLPGGGMFYPILGQTFTGRKQ